MENTNLKENQNISGEDYEYKELRFKDVIIFIHTYINELVSNRNWIVSKASKFMIFGILWFVFFIYSNSPKESSRFSLSDFTNYRSIIEFVVNEHSIDKNGNININKVPLSNIWGDNKKREILELTLMTETVIDSSNKILGNQIIEEFGLQEYWQKEEILNNLNSSSLADFKFKHTDISKFNNSELRALYSLGNILLGKDITNMSFATYKLRRTEKFAAAPDPDGPPKSPDIKPFLGSESSPLKIYGEFPTYIEFLTPNKELSTRFTHVLFEKVKGVYFERTDEIRNESLEKLNEFIDSTSKELVKTKVLRDDSYSVIKAERERIVDELLDGQLQIVPEKLVTQDLIAVHEKFSTEYDRQASEVNRLENNIENIKFKLHNQSTEFEILDQSFVPKRIVPKSYFANNFGNFIQFWILLIKSFLVGLILCSIFVLYKRMVSDALGSN